MATNWKISNNGRRWHKFSRRGLTPSLYDNHLTANLFLLGLDPRLLFPGCIRYVLPDLVGRNHANGDETFRYEFFFIKSPFQPGEGTLVVPIRATEVAALVLDTDAFLAMIFRALADDAPHDLWNG